ncbi:NAD(P)/FAD-dependent oxidoreductase [soil metagenome]
MKKNPEQIAFDILIIGGGAAGFFAAINAAETSEGKKICILEKSTKVLSKVRVSGGGRCNVTHACFDNRELTKFYPRGGKELRGAFSRFNVNDTVNWFKKRNIELKTEKDGRMFPVTDSSETIVECFVTEAEKRNIEIRMQTTVTGIFEDSKGFQIEINNTEKIFTKKLIIAAGGNAKSVGYDFLIQTGHTIIPPVPSLFTFNIPGNPIIELMGVSVENATVRIENTSIITNGPLLITHWGMSGPVVLKASAWGARELANRNYDFLAIINWLGEMKENEIFERLIADRKNFNAQLVSNSNSFKIVKRLWNFMLNKSRIDQGIRWADLSNKQLRDLTQILSADRYEVKGKTTFKEEFVTCGGINLSEINFKTMESRKMENLFFAGEILDIDGVTGGFNFQAAWTTGYLSGTAAAESLD